MLATVSAALVLAAASTPDLGVLHQYAAVALDPAGKLIASVESVRKPNATTQEHGAVIVRTTDGRIRARLDPCSNCKYDDIAWSPDGHAFVFVANADGRATLFAATPEDFTTTRIVDLAGLLASPRWSPDSHTIAVLATSGAHKESGATRAGAREVDRRVRKAAHVRTVIHLLSEG